MRIAVVSPYALDLPGGVQGQALGLARAFAERDEVVLLGPSARRLREELEVNVVELGRPTSVPVNGSRAPVALAPSAWRRARGAITAFRPDVVHLHEPLVPLVGPAALASAAPVVVTFHRADASLPYRLTRPVARRLLARVSDRVAVSPAAAATIRTVLAEPGLELSLLPNAVSIGRFAGVDPLRPRLADGVLDVVFVGRLEARKGAAVVIDALRRVVAPVRLSVVGDGPERHALTRLADGLAVEFLGRLDDDALARRLAGADLVVAPSLRGESFGVVLLEAMAAGTAVLASDLPGYRDAGGDAVRYAPAGSVAAWAAAMDELAASPERRASLAAAGTARVARFDFGALAASYRERFQLVLAR